MRLLASAVCLLVISCARPELPTLAIRDVNVVDVLSAPALAGDTCELRSQFLDSESGDPVPGMIVVATDATTNASFSVVTDLQGIARFPALPRRAQYVLKSEYPGAVPITEVVACSEDAASVTLRMAFIHSVSLISLIANARDHHGRYVRVTGVLRLEFEGDALYATPDDARHRIGRNSVWVHVPRQLRRAGERLNKKYVQVVGRFDADDRGHMDGCAGSFHDVREVSRYPY